MVQRKIEELNQTICKIQKDHKKDLEETLMPYKVAWEQAKENHNKASNEIDRLASENKSLREELKEYSLAFNPEVEASSTLWSLLSGLFPKNRSKTSPAQFMDAVKKQVASLQGEVKSLKEDVGQKEAGMVLLQTEFDRAKQLHHETLEKLNQCLCAVKSFVLAELKSDLEECMCKTAEIKAYLDDTECQNPGKSNETKFKVEHLHPGSEPEIRVIICSDQCHDMFEDLASRASERFGLAKERLFFKYTDSEGDTISVYSIDELKQALSQFPSSTPKLKLCQRQSSPSEMVQQAGSGLTTDEAAGRS